VFFTPARETATHTEFGISLTAGKTERRMLGAKKKWNKYLFFGHKLKIC